MSIRNVSYVTPNCHNFRPPLSFQICRYWTGYGLFLGLHIVANIYIYLSIPLHIMY